MKTCMRYLAVIFAVAMMICALSSVSAAFPDVTNDNAHVEAIETMTNLGIVGGYEDGSFRPDQLVRRDEMAKLIYVTYTTYVDAGEGELTFPDVSKKSWAKGYISWCAGKKIVGGYEDGSFRPAENITYDEALKMVCAMLGYTDFKSDLWPVDVRQKGLIDLKLGEKLEEVTGDTALTRAQIVQLIYNAFDKPMYQTNDTTNTAIGEIVNSKNAATIKSAIWGITEIEAQVIGTENYGLVDYENAINGTKTDAEDVIAVRFNYDNGTAENVRIKLEEIGLESYAGNTDALIALNINIIRRDATEEYVSASLKGIRKDNITSGSMATDGLAADERFKINGEWHAKYGVILDGITHANEEFLALRRLTYFEDKVLVTNPHVDGNGNYVGEMRNIISKDTSYNGSHSRWGENSFALTQSAYSKYLSGIDADADGYYDYFILEWNELFKVKRVTSKTVELEYLYSNKAPNWAPVPAYNVPDSTDVIPAADLVFPIENVKVLTAIEKDMIVEGYQLGDTFTIMAETVSQTGFCTKFDAGSTKFTLDSGKVLGGAYSYRHNWESNNYYSAAITEFRSAMAPLIGVNPRTGTFNYGRYYTIEDKIAWVETITAEEAGDTGAGLNKAILLYVTEPTDPQINEATKAHEVYYPAYLIINGRTQLVNLNPEDAIDGATGAYVSQNGSPYRPYAISDNGVSRVMYCNLLVTYDIDSDGYYSLNLEAQDVENEEGTVVEKVIQAAAGHTISVDSATGIVSIKKDGVSVQSRVVLGDSTIMYYPYTKVATGAHEYIDYYLASELPEDFEEANVAEDSNIYLTYDETTGLWVLGALMLEGELEGATDSTDYTTDARAHLFAHVESEAIVDGEDVYASYYFKNLHTYEDVEHVNKKLAYNVAKQTELGKIYAWDADDKDYKEINDLNCPDSIKSDVVNSIITDMGVVFTNLWFTDGVKIDETVKIIAVTDKETAETKVIDIEELAQQLALIEEYNEEKSASEVLSAKLGIYEDDNGDKQLAYMLIDWIEYDAELEAYTFAGIEK
ncbi:MAG: S-layer homology domain-containing protein [Clostridia bacterium]|nr:S-layer homology domain-containing protein [Clostridia bacterium]